MTLQKRLKRIMRRREMRVADLARHFEVPYTTVREWVLYGREPAYNPRVRAKVIERRLEALEKGA